MAAAAGLIAFSLSACSMGSGLALSSAKVQGYALSQDALSQIRPGQSEDLVIVVLGSPQTVNAFTEGNAWYYVETKVDQTAFGLTTVRERTVLAIYFDKNKKVADKAIYTAKDGKLFTIEGRKTPSYGEDKSFIESLIDSI
jgi:outer membrane protein assembly factor BamE (lipoprotein component of BamABCDE complex)